MEEKKKKKQKQRHFLLVHGMCHGAWCWYKIASLLKSSGHIVTALDMAASGIHPNQPNQVVSISEYVQPLIDFFISLPEDKKVILVAHSFGGLSASILMQMFPQKISAAVFAAANMPGPHLSFAALREEFCKTVDFMDLQYKFDNGPNSPPTSLLFGPENMAIQLYQLSPPEDLMLGMMLIRPHPLHDDDALQKEAILTKEKFGSISRIYIMCGLDNLYKQDYQRWMVENNPPDEVMLISNSDHMPMFSTPQKFYLCLEEVANKYS